MFDTDDPYELTRQLSSSYDKRIEVSRIYIQHKQLEVKMLREEQLRKENPALKDAYDQYQMLLKLVGKE